MFEVVVLSLIKKWMADLVIDELGNFEEKHQSKTWNIVLLW